MPSTRDKRFGLFLKELSSGAGLPGSGAAGAIALALAAGCAAKAADLSLKRRPDDPTLTDARGRLMSCMDQAMRGSDDDSERFSEFLTRRDASSAMQVIEADRTLLALVDEIRSMIELLDPEVRRDVVGDLIAARVLSEAARAIQAHNIEEMQRRQPPPQGG